MARKRRKWRKILSLLTEPDHRNGTNRRIEIPIEIYQKIMYWVKRAEDREVSGFGKVERIGPHFRIVDAILVEQENYGGYTSLKAHSLAQAEYALKDTPGDFNYWWHSHHYFDAFWSKTDLDTITDLGRHGYLLATVFNRRGEHTSAVYDRHSTPPLTKNLSLEITHPVTAHQRILWNEQYEALVTECTWKPDEKRTLLRTLDDAQTQDSTRAASHRDTSDMVADWLTRRERNASKKTLKAGME